MSARTLDLDALMLDSGGHSSFEQGACLLEAASYLAGEPWSDHPQCVSPVLGAFGRRLNDRLGDEDRQKLKPFIPRLLGTADDGKDDLRGWMSLDWSVRVATPRWLDAAGLTERAATLRALAPVVDRATADAARSAVWEARDEAVEARRASRSRLREAVRSELEKRGVAVDADAAVAVAVAVAVDADAAAAVDADAAVAVAVAVDADAAVAVAVAVDAAAAVDAAVDDLAYGTAGYWKVYDTVKAKLIPIYQEKLREGALADAVATTNREAIELLGRLIDPTAEAK